MFVNEGFVEEVRAMLEPRVAEAGIYLANHIKARLMENQGSVVVPLAFSEPGEIPFHQSGGLAESIQYKKGSDDQHMAVVLSDAVDAGAHLGLHYSGKVEFGHDWDGKAYDPDSRKVVQVSAPHEVAPRPYMRPGLQDCIRPIFAIISGRGLAQ